MGKGNSRPISKPTRIDPHSATKRIETMNPRKIGPPPPPSDNNPPDLTGKK
jgi:hypothetical protein